jgi:16S rRNA (uracil1498-N3)-methyltransferase
MRDHEHNLFYRAPVNTDNTFTLDASESNHAASVLRIKIGQQIQVTDGNGAIYDCLCTSIDKRSVSCDIVDKRQIPRITPEVTLLIGLPDKERFETVLEHATALGVSRVIPLAAEHCRKPWWGAWEGLRQRFLSKMIVSMKQCLYPYIPRLDAPTPFREAIDKCEGVLFVADQNGKCLRDTDILPHKKICCLVGPPGGMSDGEMMTLKSYTAIPVATVSIAPARLRSELAATVLCSRVIGAPLISDTATAPP